MSILTVGKKPAGNLERLDFHLSYIATYIISFTCSLKSIECCERDRFKVGLEKETENKTFKIIMLILKQWCIGKLYIPLVHGYQKKNYIKN